jgi:hypothetical protein
MIKTILRVLTAVLGALALILALRLWLDPAAAAAKLGLVGRGALGLATLRADVAGFAAAGGLAIAGAVRDDRRLLTAPALLIALALAGRLITLAQMGSTPDQVMPMAAEAVLVLLLVAARRTLGARQSTMRQAESSDRSIVL